MEPLTLEQAAENYSPNRTTCHTLELEKVAFKAGAEWQKEQYKLRAEVINSKLDGSRQHIFDAIIAELLQD